MKVRGVKATFRKDWDTATMGCAYNTDIVYWRYTDINMEMGMNVQKRSLGFRPMWRCP